MQTRSPLPFEIDHGPVHSGYLRRIGSLLPGVLLLGLVHAAVPGSPIAMAVEASAAVFAWSIHARSATAVAIAAVRRP